MRILDKYIIKNFLAPLIYCLLLFIILYVIIDLFGHLDEILKNKMSLWVLQKYYLSMAPMVIMHTTPIASLMATVFAISTMNRHDEILAMRASGINTFRILSPFLFIGAIIAIVLLLVSEKILPISSKESLSIKENFIDKPSKEGDSAELNNIALYGKGNKLIFIESIDRAQGIINKATILDQDAFGNVTKKINAQRGLWTNSGWLLYDVIIYELDQKGGLKGNPEYFEETAFDMEAPRILVSKATDYESMSFKDLSKYIQNFSNASKTTLTKLKVDLYQKISFPFTSLVLIIIGSSFAIRIKKRGRSSAIMGVGISIIIGFLYYAFMSTFLALGKGGILPPFLSAHLANIIFGITGLFLIRN